MSHRQEKKKKISLRNVSCQKERNRLMFSSGSPSLCRTCRESQDVDIIIFFIVIITLGWWRKRKRPSPVGGRGGGTEERLNASQQAVNKQRGSAVRRARDPPGGRQNVWHSGKMKATDWFISRQ